MRQQLPESVTFRSEARTVAVMPRFSEKDIKNEPMLFSCDAETAMREGGPITRAFLQAIPSQLAGSVIDTRTHMLMDGWYPAIPGWHHDDVVRTWPGNQPNYDIRTTVEHFACIVGAWISATDFALGECTLALPDPGEIIYRHWHPQVDRLVENGALERMTAGDSAIIQFDDRTLHQATPAKEFGWRWFGRLSKFSPRPILNQVRTQVQVYLTEPFKGW